ncbi:MAG TPA: hypothetical protein VIJ14_00385 [Rhabdochlamydiaceae bacterium]
MSWIQNLEVDAKGAVADLENIQWKSDIHAASTKVDTFAQELSAILSGLPEHGAAMLALQALAATVANISAAVANGTVTAPVAAVAVAPVVPAA